VTRSGQDFEAKSIKGSCNTPTHIRKYIDGSIERLGGPPDLYCGSLSHASAQAYARPDLHRIDPSRSVSLCVNSLIYMSDTPIEESIKALDEVRKAGKTKYIGVSEPSAATLRKAHSSKSLMCA
jgi:aryl-alcohol dehydrogenase-like predicted oxidoreductase